MQSKALHILSLWLLFGAVTTQAQTIRGKIYGGGQLAIVDGNTKVQINSGTVGDGTDFDGGVFGGGLGEQTVVTGNVDVLIGKEGSAKDAAGPTINGDVYGGSALGSVNGTVVTDEKKTNVTLYAGVIYGSLYGGALGQKAGINDATSDIAANVYGPVQVTQYGGNVWYTDNTGTNGSGGIYGCNNLNGEPKNTVKVDIYRTNSHNSGENADDYTDDKYAVFAVYGGGNQASYSTGTPEVTVHGCDNSIEYVYGGGNAAHLTHETNGNTNVTIYGCELINNVFGGGNGQVQAANVSGNTNVAIYGGKIINVFGGSNTNGMIGGATNVNVLAQGEGEDSACEMLVTNVYGGGNKAAGKSGTVSIACTGAGTIKNVYGGANEADITGDITLNISGGKIINAFGGNNSSGRINGAITVNVDWTDDDTCGENSLTNVYGGGNLAPYYAYGYDDDGKEKNPVNGEVYGPIVNINNGTVSNNVYGGGLGAAAVITGTPTVNLIGGAVEGDVFGGGDAAPVIGNTLVALTNTSLGKWTDEGTWTSGGDIYGGGNVANVDGIAGVKINSGKVHDVYGGGNAADVTNTNVLISDGTINRVFGGGHGNKGSNEDPENPVAAVAANVVKDSEGNGGNAYVKVEGGTIYQVFAAGNQLGAINGQATLEIEKKQLGADATPEQIAALPKLNVTEAYGGGNQADGNAGMVIVGCTGNDDEGVKDVFGGAREADVTSDITLNIKGGNIDRVFGGNNVSGNVNGAIQVNIDEEPESCGLNLNYVYGGGQDAAYTPTTSGAYPEVNIKNGTVQHDVFGGGLGVTAIVTSNPVVNIIGGTIGNDVYGGGALADVEGNTTVILTGGTVTGNAYGGGLGQLADAETGKEAIEAHVYGNTLVNLGSMLDDGAGNLTPTGSATVNNIFGCNNLNGGPTGTVAVNVINGTVSHNVYGGGNLAAATTTPNVNIKGGTVTENVFGGGYGTTAIITGSPVVEVSGGTVTKDVYGGGALADVSGNTSVIISGGTSGNVYGGGLGQLEDAEAGKETVAATVVNSSVLVTGGTANNVFGCNNTYGGPTGTVNVEIAGGTINNNVFGGGNLADAKVNPVVTVNGGTVTHDVYGGGALANIDGYTTVNLFNGTVGGAYGGALGAKKGVNDATEDVEAIVSGNTSVTLGKAVGDGTYTATVVTGDGIFGANNLNGTPQGHAYVHVIKTAPRTGSFEYHVPAVYGGGNLSAYEPTNENDFAEVLIENCDNSIEYVYGGGNAAPVPATKVTIYGANAINHAFAGGNGAGDGNPGADVGYLDYYSTPTPAASEYGTGKASITVYGGTVHNVYGGSNTLGYIRGGTTVSVTNASDDPESLDYYAGTICPLNVGHVYGGGNEADINCDVTINCDCSEGGKILYAGANNADVNGSITLNIHSGTYGQVFCGNNQGGAVKGKLEVNVDEIGCWPVMIGELYGCGNMAPYSVYGYDNDGNCIQSADDMTMEKAYEDPLVNLISFTRIGKVFGGGYGETAVLYGNTHVSVEPIKGIFAGKTVPPLYVLDGSDERVLLADATTMPYGITNNGDNTITIAEDAGSIGSIFGGGNAGAVYGNTNVEIGLIEENVHMNDFPTTDKEVAVTITGDVFGGGEKAIVSGDTNVKIGE